MESATVSIIVSMDKSNLWQMFDTNGKLLQQIYMPTKDFAYVVQNEQLLFYTEENQNDIKNVYTDWGRYMDISS